MAREKVVAREGGVNPLNVQNAEKKQSSSRREIQYGGRTESQIRQQVKNNGGDKVRADAVVKAQKLLKRKFKTTTEASEKAKKAGYNIIWKGYGGFDFTENGGDFVIQAVRQEDGRMLISPVTHSREQYRKWYNR